MDIWGADNQGLTVLGDYDDITCCSCFNTCRFLVFSLRTQAGLSWIRKVDNAIHWIKLYANDCTIASPTCNTYPLDSDLSNEECYLTFEQLGPVGYVRKYWLWCFPPRVLGTWSAIFCSFLGGSSEMPFPEKYITQHIHARYCFHIIYSFELKLCRMVELCIPKNPMFFVFLF